MTWPAMSEIWVCEAHRTDGALYGREVFTGRDAGHQADKYGKSMRAIGYRAFVWQM